MKHRELIRFLVMSALSAVRAADDGRAGLLRAGTMANKAS